MATIVYFDKGISLSMETKIVLGIEQRTNVTHKLNEPVTLPGSYNYPSEIKDSKIKQMVCSHILLDERGGMGDGYNCVLCGYSFYDNDKEVARAERNGRMINLARLSDPESQTPLYLIANALEIRGRQLSGLL